VVCQRRVSDPPPEIAGLLQTMVQQQTAILQQQAALLQVHGETVRLQGLLLEHLLRMPVRESAEVPNSPEASRISLGSSTNTASPTPIDDQTMASSAGTARDAPTDLQEPAATADGVEGRDPATDNDPAPLAGGPLASRAARYYQRTAGSTSVSVQHQDLALMRRLHEMGDVCGLILQFGPYRGSTLAQVAMRQPEYLRQLVRRAQRPEVRAAAARVAQALQAESQHKRSAGRRGRPAA
jgi:hypothetical protein